jgi:hypothetical protein
LSQHNELSLRNKRGSALLSTRKVGKVTDLDQLTKPEVEWAKDYGATEGNRPLVALHL